ncbi:shikimate dehydrogenase [Vannielia litorea]|uniref:shikimate dehydrogenase family protein n=1 Tax=Vannielia litorea TaxID=1217970 RepID=UPI001C96F838|nr:shikimate dehydrogenase [Vannielia litorea]MBY6153701.1 shikimate dehydrogenase [Vannielia litorea]
MPDLLLGLIGDNIAASSSPRLHRLAGAQNGMEVQYDSLIPPAIGEDFDTIFARCAREGYRGVNVTYPYKEYVARKVEVSDPLVAAMGAVNTVLFEPGGPTGWNTDYTGFMAAYRAARGEVGPGKVCLVGTGGVGRALAFALVALEAAELRLVDRDTAKAEALAEELRAASRGTEVVTGTEVDALAAGATGLVNATPVGMVGHDGTAIPARCLPGAEWAFDAVYTPLDTRFLQDAEAAGLSIISGFELFFWQGVHAWAHFSGKPLDEPALYAALRNKTPA